MSQREIGSSRGSAEPQQGLRSGMRNGRGQRNWQLLAELEDRHELSGAWLTLSLSMVSGVTQAVVLLREEQGEGFLPAAMWPEGATKLDSLGLAAQKALQAGQAVEGSFSDGLTPIFCKQVQVFSVLRLLQDIYPSAPLQMLNFSECSSRKM